MTHHEEHNGIMVTTFDTIDDYLNDASNVRFDLDDYDPEVRDMINHCGHVDGLPF